MLAMLQGFVDNLPQNEDQPPTPPLNPVTNAASQQDVQLEMLCILQEIRLHYAAGHGGKGGRGGRGGRVQGNRNRNCRTPDNTNLARYITDQYCSTYGSFNQASRVTIIKQQTMMMMQRWAIASVAQTCFVY